MNAWKRRFLLGGSIIFVLMLSACGSSSTGNSSGSSSGPISLKIMVGGLSKQIYLPNELTQKLGYFAQQGLNVTLIDEASGQSAENEVLAGQVDAGSGSYNHTIELQAAGKQMEAVVQLDIAPAGTHTLSIALLHKAGLAPDQAHFVPVGAGDTFIAAMQQGKIDAGMTTEPTISRLIASGVGKVLVDLRTPQSTQAALGGSYPFICVFMENSYVSSHKDVVQKLVNAYVKTLQWIHTHTAAQIADMMPADYYAGNRDLYVTALQNQLSIFSPDGKMPSDGPQSVLNIEQQTNQAVQGKQIDLSTTYTNEFASNAS